MCCFFYVRLLLKYHYLNSRLNNQRSKISFQEEDNNLPRLK